MKEAVLKKSKGAGKVKGDTVVGESDEHWDGWPKISTKDEG